jgi:hypothetical protein
MERETTTSEMLHTIEVVDLASPDDEIEPSIFSPTATVSPTEQFLANGKSTSTSSTVFHFMRADDTNRQDIISMGEILEPSTKNPSWAKLVEILQASDDFGLAFKVSRELPTVNNQIRVGNERQFLAYLQYLRNFRLLNSEALVCGR